jgi:predicted dehydrogenase
MTDRLPIGVVGVGALGRHHARHLSTIEDADLVGIYDIDSTTAKTVAEEVGTIACTSLDDLLNRVKAVSIAVPTVEHLSVGMEALSRGIPVLMEKPLAATRPVSSSRWATSSDSIAHCGPQSHSSMGPCTSRAIA